MVVILIVVILVIVVLAHTDSAYHMESTCILL